MAQLDHGLDLEFPFGQKLAGSRSLTVEDRRLIFPAKTLVRSSALSCLDISFKFDYFGYIIMEEVTAMSAAASHSPTIPSEDDVKLAKETRKILALRLSSNMPLDLREVSMPQEPPIRIPAPAAYLLVQILDEMSRGNAVKLLPIHAVKGGAKLGQCGGVKVGQLMTV
jgi:hypothetical protein